MPVERKTIYEDNVIFPDEDGMVIDVEYEEPSDIVKGEDGSTTVFLDGAPQSQELVEYEYDHFENLAESMSETRLMEISSDLRQGYDADLSSRKEWERRYRNGLQLLGFEVEDRTEPWMGASGVYHPILAETVVQFQSNAIMELCPPGGPAQYKIIGEETTEKLRRGRRKKEELNFQTMYRMPEYRVELDNLLFRLPLSGVALRKVYFDSVRKRPCARLVPAEDFVIQFGASDLETCPRYTHRQRLFRSELLALQESGFYRNIPILPGTPESDQIKEEMNKLDGLEASYIEDDRNLILEVHCDYVIDEANAETERPIPYVITLDYDSGRVLSIRRNWLEDDDTYTKIVHFTVYRYMPGFGFYGVGLIHLIGGPTEAVTSMLRQLIDAGTLSIVPCGFKTRSFRIVGDDTPLSPGEFRDVDIGSDDINKGISFLPTKEPNVVVANMMESFVGEIRRVASAADMKLGDTSANAPVGTMMALLERSLRVMSAVHARLHASLGQELQTISFIIGNFMPPEYEYDQELQFNRQDDFADNRDIIPVSDPNSATQAQRAIVYNAILQLAQNAPNVYNMAQLHRDALEIFGIKNPERIVPLADEVQPMDPISENMAMLTGKPVKAFLWQDHEAHIRAHVAAAQDPKIAELVGQSPNANVVMGALASHVQEHLAFGYRRDIERKIGMQLPPPGEPLPEDMEASISRLAAEAGEEILKEHALEAQMAKQKQALMDPQIQVDIMEIEQRKDAKLIDAQLAREELAAKERMHAQDIRSKEIIEGVKLSSADRKSRRDDETKRLAEENKIRQGNAQILAGDRKSQRDDATKRYTSDRQIAAGEKKSQRDDETKRRTTMASLTAQDRKSQRDTASKERQSSRDLAQKERQSSRDDATKRQTASQSEATKRQISKDTLSSQERTAVKQMIMDAINSDKDRTSQESQANKDRAAKVSQSDKDRESSENQAKDKNKLEKEKIKSAAKKPKKNDKT
jgi:hypothetical protein